MTNRTVRFDREEITYVTYQLSLNEQEYRDFKNMSCIDQETFCALHVDDALLCGSTGESDQRLISGIEVDEDDE